MIRSKIRKINPERSNKMIYAIAGGLAIVLLAFFTLIIVGGGQGGGSRPMAKILSYLKNTEGLMEIRPLEAEKRVLIIFNSDSKNAGNFEKIAHYAALRLSRQWPDCEVLLARNKADRIVYGVRVQGGVLVGEGPLPAPEESK
jgi:hypothetical protein